MVTNHIFKDANKIILDFWLNTCRCVGDSHGWLWIVDWCQAFLLCREGVLSIAEKSLQRCRGEFPQRAAEHDVFRLEKTVTIWNFLKTPGWQHACLIPRIHVKWHTRNIDVQQPRIVKTFNLRVSGNTLGCFDSKIIINSISYIATWMFKTQDWHKATCILKTEQF